MRNLLSTFKKMVICMLPLFVVACHVSPAWAEKSTCTGVLKFDYEAKKRLLNKSKMGVAARKLSNELLDYYYEDQWLICKQMENTNERKQDATPGQLRQSAVQDPE